jgi:hypothetical protein
MPLEVFTSHDPDGAGRRHWERGIRAGTLLRLRRGAFVLAAEWRAADPETRHRAAMDALALTSRRAPVFARESAALLHGIPVLGGISAEPHLLDSELGNASRRSPRGVVVHRPRHLPGIARVGDLLATDPASTALALAASRRLPAGLAALDHVLAAGVGRHDLEGLFDAWYPFHGSRRARWALESATGRAETPLESISLAGILLAHLPPPRQQVELRAHGRNYRLDFFWEGINVVGEADGHLKYRTAEDLIAEKDREDDIRSLGFGFARWDWDDAWARTPMLAKLARAGVVAPPSAPNSARRGRSLAPMAE